MPWSETADGHRRFEMVLHRDNDVGLLMSAEQAEYVTRCLVATVPEHPNDRRLRQITLRGLRAAELGMDVWDGPAPIEITNTVAHGDHPRATWSNNDAGA